VLFLRQNTKMESMELLIAMQQMMERQIGSLASKMDTNQAKAEADRKAWQEEIEARTKAIHAET
jgi:hypothetical protein